MTLTGRTGISPLSNDRARMCEQHRNAIKAEITSAQSARRETNHQSHRPSYSVNRSTDTVVQAKVGSSQCKAGSVVTDWLVNATYTRESSSEKRKLSVHSATASDTGREVKYCCSQSQAALLHPQALPRPLAPALFNPSFTTSSCQSFGRPLTATNLRYLETNTMPTQQPATPSPSKKTSTTTASVACRRADEVRNVLRLNGMQLDGGEETEISIPILEAAREIYDGQRGSAMKSRSLKKLKGAREKGATSNELTFQVQFWSKLLRDERLVQSWRLSTEHTAGPPEPRNDVEDEQSKLDGEDQSVHQDWLERAWDQDHLKGNWCADFPSNAVPILQSGDNSYLANLMKSFPRVQTPRPDLAYGLSHTAFTQQQQSINTMYSDWAKTSNDLYHGFFLIECKTDGSIEAAENQACRGGATLVNARMEFNRRCARGGELPSLWTSAERSTDAISDATQAPSTTQSSSKADLDSFAFSLVLVPAMANLYVHWAECKAFEKPTFRMSVLEQYRLLNGRDLTKLRHDINNILDWGTLKRKREIVELMAPLEKQIEEGNKRQKVQ